MNYHQVLNHLGITRDISSVFYCNPDIATGHCCLNLSCTEGVDHISCAHWVGDTVVGCCDLLTSWNQGKVKVIEILKTSQVHPSAYNFATYFIPTSSIDLLCVFREAMYPGINQEGDNADQDDISIPGPSPTTPVTILGEGESKEPENGEELPFTFEKAVDEAFDDTCPDDPDDEEMDDTNIHSAPTLPKGSGVHACDYLLVKGKAVHKSSVVQLIVNKEFTSKFQ
ncbi:hypothetical protein BDN67DRAFT_1016735, partial [Paxillus ammoniavirescens]